MIRVFQRHCNFSTNSEHKLRPIWFDREQLFRQLLFTVTGSTNVNITAFHDSGNGSIEDHFLRQYKIHPYVDVISQEGGNDAKSFLNLLNYVSSQDYDDNDIIYFLEDDYAHRENWHKVLQDVFDTLNVDYVTLYDHPDKYTEIYSNLQSAIFVTKYAHWRTTPSTTNTYACKFSTLKNHIDIHRKYCDLEAGWTKDHDKFIDLWKFGSNLISCIPGYSSHIESSMLSPLTDWSKI